MLKRVGRRERGAQSGLPSVSEPRLLVREVQRLCRNAAAAQLAIQTLLGCLTVGRLQFANQGDGCPSDGSIESIVLRSVLEC